MHGPGRAETLTRVGPAWAATMRLSGPEALHRTAAPLGRGTTPTMRELPMPRTYLHPAGARALTDAGVRVIAVPDAGHNIMLDNPEAFAAATAAALKA
ncbi:hypothetical protein ACFO1B_56905 [Dactylosporangium siamense]|uniref:Alpha/beta hydrolase n=1 Tax=Dactylosporangium siamense TaxID=685454 RepID=A0A919UDI0_9ACTN|nr:hypothetical protein [Dactylosporangium siamense]GIG51504.1 hypothetical protein Dsi01nite_095450 [Dactylosporangium siamense]